MPKKPNERKEQDDQLRLQGERLRSLREAHGSRLGRKLYQRDVARFLSINEETYRSYEYGRAQLPEDFARKLAGEWGIRWQEFYAVRKKNVSRSDSERAIHISGDLGSPKIPAGTMEVPLPYIGFVAAGTKVDWTDPFEAEEMEYVPEEMAARGRFCCRISGDSCYPWLWPDDLCIWQHHEAPRLGSIVVHVTPDNRATTKQLKHDGERFILHPANPGYADEPATGRVLGYLVGVKRKLGSLSVSIYKDGEPITPSDFSGLFSGNL